MTGTEAAAEKLRLIAGVARARNGRLAIDWISRRQKPRWRMVLLDGQYYNRRRLRELLDRRPAPAAVPASRRQLRDPEIEDIVDSNPWGLYPPRR